MPAAQWLTWQLPPAITRSQSIRRISPLLTGCGVLRPAAIGDAAGSLSCDDRRLIPGLGEFAQHPMHELYADRSLAHRRSNTFDASGAHVTGSEDPRHAALEQVRRPWQVPMCIRQLFPPKVGSGFYKTR